MNGGTNVAGEKPSAAYAFPKHYRLLKTDEYSSVFAFRQALRSRHFLLHYRRRDVTEAPAARLGLVVAKRYLRRAIDRNLIRRLVRERFRLLHPQLRPCDLVVRLAARPTPLDRRVLAKEIGGLLARMLTSGR